MLSNKKFEILKMRQTALGAVRSQMRHDGTDPASASYNQAWAVLDNIARAEPTLVASQWYLTHGESVSEFRAFRREWYEQRKSNDVK